MKKISASLLRRLLFASTIALLAFAAAGSSAFAQLPWVGLSSVGAKVYAESGAGREAPAYRDHFGRALAAGDFDANGADDLVVGVPENDCDATATDCGSVVIRWGSPGVGLTATTTILDQLVPGSPDTPHRSDRFGEALATGDFNGDGHDDLAVGVPGNWIYHNGSEFDAGGVELHFGTAGGITSGGYLFRPGTFGIEGLPGGSSKFGSSIAFGDFNGDGRDEIAVGAPQEYNSVEGFSYRTGAVYLIDSNVEGAIAGFKMLQGDQGLPDTPEDWELFGAAVAAGDFNRDGYDDLAIGVPGEDGVGAVLTVYGSPWSLLFASHWYFSQWDLGEVPELNDEFGKRLAVGDFDHDGFDDLVVGAPGEDANDGVPADIGLVTVVYGSSSGLGLERVAWWWEDLLHGAGHSESYDNFSDALAVGDFDGDGVDDLAVASPGEDGALMESGAVTLLQGRASHGLIGGIRRASPEAPAMIPGGGEGRPYTGDALAAGDFDGNGFADLAIAAPYREVGGVEDAGSVAVLRGALFADGLEGTGTQAWSSTLP
jgi:hypothetical protein